MLLLNMVEPDELYSDEDYNDILEDINEECSKYGEVEGVRVPRPVPKSKKWEPTDSAAATAAKAKEADDEAGVGRVFVLFREVESTKKAMKAIGGRQFAGRTILVASVSEVSSDRPSLQCGIWADAFTFPGGVPWTRATPSTARGSGRCCCRRRQGHHGGSCLTV